MSLAQRQARADQRIVYLRQFNARVCQHFLRILTRLTDPSGPFNLKREPEIDNEADYQRSYVRSILSHQLKPLPESFIQDLSYHLGIAIATQDRSQACVAYCVKLIRDYVNDGDYETADEIVELLKHL